MNYVGGLGHYGGLTCRAGAEAAFLRSVQPQLLSRKHLGWPPKRIEISINRPFYMTRIALIILFFNTLCFLAFALDKRKAQQGQRRISEKTLHLATLPGAALGAWAAIFLLHHKNQKATFWRITLLLTLLQGAVFYFLALPHFRA
ncbi:DUF1294 domain-containing protein [Hymenobacter bucti]|uniref:DUF1294 domain-containing protein n=1 Tax=Hymenobacter bucti TaxID=1844114 RepID=A0ABW4QSP7_9BACT